MRQQFLLVVCVILLNSCKTYLDTTGNDIATDYMTFKYLKNHNELDYFNKVNALADKDVFRTTHFSINLPKNIVYWKQLGNNFYYEYDSKQIISVHTAYKNEGTESDRWELKNVNERNDLKYLEEYWNERKYDDKLLDNRRKDRVTQIFTNGKYEILLYNIKSEKFNSFFDLVKTFKVKN